MFCKGDEVMNLKAPGWGCGEVLRNEENSRVHICFENAGDKLIALNHAELVKVGTGIGPAQELGKSSEGRGAIEVIATFPFNYDKCAR